MFLSYYWKCLWFHEMFFFWLQKLKPKRIKGRKKSLWVDKETWKKTTLQVFLQCFKLTTWWIMYEYSLYVNMFLPTHKTTSSTTSISGKSVGEYVFTLVLCSLFKIAQNLFFEFVMVKNIFFRFQIYLIFNN